MFTRQASKFFCLTLTVIITSILHANDSYAAAQIQAGIYKQQIDHRGETESSGGISSVSGGTFEQRFWFDSEFAKGDNAPVLFRICGEAACDLHFLHDMTIEFASQLGAHIVYLEHRYYGKSQPFVDLSTEHLQFLTLDNAIDDLVSFQKWITQDRKWTGKWISIGGSYSGTLSAIYRLKHPELVIGALAASAPMYSQPSETSDGQEIMDRLSSINISTNSDFGWRQWTYQACTDVGFWQAHGFTLNDPSPWLCNKLFGKSAPVDKNNYNEKYYTPFITSNSAPAIANILFTYGTTDVWTDLGINPASNKNPGIVIKIIEGGGHHSDLNYPDKNSDSSETIEARALFLSLAKGWLK